jgi:hypothetical protein
MAQLDFSSLGEDFLTVYTMLGTSIDKVFLP